MAKINLDDDWMRELPWKPRPLRREFRPEEYPVAYMPPVIVEAVREVQAYTQAPMAMVAACALSVVSAAVQTRYGVQRDAALRGPASLYLITVAESGERKTAVDKMFMEPLREWEAQQMRAAREQKAQYEAAMEDWERDKASMDNMIAQGTKYPNLGTELDPRVQHELRKPEEPRLARMLRGDDTPEALSIALQNYPVAAVITSEAGVIFGSHGMSKESVTRNLALVNAMWDGGPVSQDRVGRGSIHIERLRATMGLQVQPSVSQEFTRNTGGLARGIGYFARFLFSQAADMTDEVRNAELLEEWLTRQIRLDRNLDVSGITVRTVQQKGPGPLRIRPKLDAAVELLEDHGRIRVIQTPGSKKRYITVAPQVIREWS